MNQIKPAEKDLKKRHEFQADHRHFCTIMVQPATKTAFSSPCRVLDLIFRILELFLCPIMWQKRRHLGGILRGLTALDAVRERRASYCCKNDPMALVAEIFLY